MTHRGPSLWLSILFVATALAVAGCAGSTPSADDAQPTTSLRYLINPLDPGTGFVQLGENRYPFDGVICATGALKSDPTGSVRVFGVYANFHVGDKLAAVSLTRYRNQIAGKVQTVPTITDTAMIQMQGDGAVLGLKAQRALVEGQPKWHDVFDPTATGALITRKGDRYEAKGRFGPVDSGEADTTATTVAGQSGATVTVGEVDARCPAPSDATTTSMKPPIQSSSTAP